jgi:hypothetical protein
MTLDLSNTYIKQPSEIIPIQVNFGSLSVLPRGAKEIISATATAKKWKRTQPDIVENAPEFLDSSTPAILTPTRCKVEFRVKDGIDGYNYQVTVRVTFDNGAKLEEEVQVRVIER